ncbi:hypothetical protein [Candidatus Lucifugimonas marina]|uniref:Uncharacterized protein n=1 Tax=Candidatus Lucifugimonas marina TaxID=3038979 RepID=A0AAJ5ZGR2_9CHLR|nr:hypothetical protein [SAR202 cluster bacterium JH702]MDG0869217.1 hypothetical protein [SAR202 cluster bacterium JH639]WFG35834.1 hypothetical protein GKN94_09045 [SAR202 cluster bacterium JH545]WFG39779.1 hypothetical protein GKO48_09155 [SAR202 cluster bacterium JH1073]
MTSDSILSQDAIDALLAGSGAGSPPAPLPETTTPDVESPAIDATAKPPVAQPAATGNSEITLEQVITIAGQAAEAEATPVHDSISRIYQRIGYMEQMIARVAQLETEVDRLKRAA